MKTRWYDEVTVAELARAAGVSAPTLTNHFGDKNAPSRRGGASG